MNIMFIVLLFHFANAGLETYIFLGSQPLDYQLWQSDGPARFQDWRHRSPTIWYLGRYSADFDIGLPMFC